MAAGEGRRLLPLTERYPKPVLPIDGRPVIVTLLQDLRAAGVGRITIVVGHLADQIERLLDGFPHDLRFVRQPEHLGAADAVLRAELDPPYLVLGADTRFAPGAVATFVERAPPTRTRSRSGRGRRRRERIASRWRTAWSCASTTTTPPT